MSSVRHVIWVAHSLGTVISYNVLSDLFHRAAELKVHGDREQQLGVELFRQSLLRFVTLGSPLDKFAYLFKEAIRPWPSGVSRQTLLKSGEEQEQGRVRRKLEPKEWWINFYHVLDPVSAPLSNKLICGEKPPFNFHASIGHVAALVPGVAHVAYWSDVKTLRFILGRLFGKQVLHDKPYVPYSPEQVKAWVAVGYVVWAGVVGFGAWLVISQGPRLVASLLPSWFKIAATG